MQRAWRRAGLKLAIGSFAIAAAIGARIVLVAPEPRAVAEAGERPSGTQGPTTTSPSSIREAGEDSFSGPDTALEPQDPSLDRLAGLTGSIRERLDDSGPERREGDRIVACRLQGASQFMRADDCELRGGQVREGVR